MTPPTPTAALSDERLAEIRANCESHGPRDEGFIDWARQAHIDRIDALAEVDRLRAALATAGEDLREARAALRISNEYNRREEAARLAAQAALATAEAQRKADIVEAVKITARGNGLARDRFEQLKAERMLFARYIADAGSLMCSEWAEIREAARRLVAAADAAEKERGDE